MAPGDLQEVLAVIKPAGHAHHADLLVGLGRADDAAVYRVAPDLAIVETVDFFPPVVDDPYTDRKSTRLNSSHGYISYAVFCLKKKKHQDEAITDANTMGSE